MARTLPWLKDDPSTTTQSKPSSSRAPKRQRIQDPVSDSDASSTPGRSAKPKRNATTRADRTPSTSPPPAPPTVEAMRPGLSQDDIYIMVEDEFLSTARLYTQHLHHAEYVRLKRLAATRNSTLNPIARPVDSITTMRKETKRRKDAEKHAARTKSALGKMMGGGEARRDKAAGAGSDEEEGQEDEDERMDAPGIGTVLGDLMKKGPRQGIGGLSGLHGVKSSTRAAAGFGKMDSMSQERVKVDLKPLSKPMPSGVVEGKDVEEGENETSDDDDDLDAPVVRRPKGSASGQLPLKKELHTSNIKSTLRPPASSPYNLPPVMKPPTDSSTGPTTTTNIKPLDSSSARSKPPLKPPARLPKPVQLPDDEDFIRPSNAQTDAIRRRMQARREKEREGERKKEKPLDVEEIPIFLV